MGFVSMNTSFREFMSCRNSLLLEQSGRTTAVVAACIKFEAHIRRVKK
jgi:hypothetical protein